MIIAEKEKSTSPFQRPGGILFSGLLLCALVIALFAFDRKATKKSSLHHTTPAFRLFCDAEQVDGEEFVAGTFHVGGGSTQSDRRAFSGEYSSLLGHGKQYSMAYILENVLPGSMYVASLWVSRTSGDRARLAVTGVNDNAFYHEIMLPVVRRPDGWEQLKLYFQVPAGISEIKIYAYAPKDCGDIFIDDFLVESIEDQGFEFDELFGQEVSIEMSAESFNKLHDKKWKAIATGILITEDEDWVPAGLSTLTSGTKDARVRLKGDWLDHLYADKWSLRVKMKGENAFHGLTTFSLQSPATRSFLREWLFHQLLTAEDVLTPRYDFVKLKLNNKDLGVYACEEHFEKQLVESRGRREGPIIKLTEDAFWLGIKREYDYVGYTLPERMEEAYWQSDIRPFAENKTLQTPTLSTQFEVAQNLLFGLKYHALTPSEVFDIDKLARFLALCDVLEAYHGLAWHNIRFYYNPITTRLEPIGFDGFGEVAQTLERPFLGYHSDTEASENLIQTLFSDGAFAHLYFRHLRRYVHPAWLDSTLTQFHEGIDARQSFLLGEFDAATLDNESILARARMIRNYLDLYSVSLQARVSRRADYDMTLQLLNPAHVPIEVVGYAGNAGGDVHFFDQSVFVPTQGRFKSPTIDSVVVPGYVNVIAFRTCGSDSILFADIIPWKAPEAVIPGLRDPQLETDLTQYDFIEIQGEHVVVKNGRHTLVNDLILPPDKGCVLQSGTHLDMTNGACIVIQKHLLSMGSEDDPIFITSSDRTGGGIVVLGDHSQSILQHTHFDGLNTIQKNGWQLTGAVTFYECDLSLANCSFTSARCEDALNTVRCSLKVNGLRIVDAASDGFDADFCTGSIDNIYFNKTVNDAIDISGSQITIGTCTILSPGDKGISVGEQSHVRVLQATIQNSNIGVASKDLSTLEISDITLQDCKQGFTAYQKKPEFGPAKLIVHHARMERVRRPYLIEHGSTFMFEGVQKENL